MIKVGEDTPETLDMDDEDASTFSCEFRLKIEIVVM